MFCAADDLNSRLNSITQRLMLSLQLIPIQKAKASDKRLVSLNNMADGEGLQHGGSTAKHSGMGCCPTRTAVLAATATPTVSCPPATGPGSYRPADAGLCTSCCFAMLMLKPKSQLGNLKVAPACVSPAAAAPTGGTPAAALKLPRCQGIKGSVP